MNKGGVPKKEFVCKNMESGQSTVTMEVTDTKSGYVLSRTTQPLPEGTEVEKLQENHIHAPYAGRK